MGASGVRLRPAWPRDTPALPFVVIYLICTFKKVFPTHFKVPGVVGDCLIACIISCIIINVSVLRVWFRRTVVIRELAGRWLRRAVFKSLFLKGLIEMSCVDLLMTSLVGGCRSLRRVTLSANGSEPYVRAQRVPP